MLRLHQRGEAVHGTNAILNIRKLILIDQVEFVENDSIGKGDLSLGFVNISLRFHLIQVSVYVLGVHQAHNTVNSEVVLQNRVTVESENDRRRICQSSSLQDDGIKVLSATD